MPPPTYQRTNFAILLLAAALLSGRVALDQHPFEHALLDAGGDCAVCVLAAATPGAPPDLTVVSGDSGAGLAPSSGEPHAGHVNPWPVPPSRGPPRA